MGVVGQRFYRWSRIRCKCRTFTSTRQGFAPMRLFLLKIKVSLPHTGSINSIRLRANNNKKDRFRQHPQKSWREAKKTKKERKGRDRTTCYKLKASQFNDEVAPEDEEIDFLEPLAFTEIWHNTNNFEKTKNKNKNKNKKQNS